MSALLGVESSAAVAAVLPDVARVTLGQYTPTILSSLVSVPPPQLELVSLNILISDFAFVIDGDIVQLSQDPNAGQILMRVAIDTKVEADITLLGRKTEIGRASCRERV